MRRAAEGHTIVEDEPVVGRVGNDLAGRAGEAGDLGYSTATKLKLLAQLNDPRLA